GDSRLVEEEHLLLEEASPQRSPHELKPNLSSSGFQSSMTFTVVTR
ncbi:2840_t:CDS:1, partial [Acaulospora colombiana]